MKLALVTGAAGFLGRNTARELHRRGYAVSGLGHAFRDNESPGNYGIDVWMTDDISLESLKSFGQSFDLIVHCAGSGSVGFSLEHPREDYIKTVDTTLEVLEYMRRYNEHARMVYPSSAAVYGLKPDRPIREDEQLSPISPYGAHKSIAEVLCESYWRTYGIRSSIIRFFSLYGEGLKKQLLWDACNRICEMTESPIFFGTGNETRDWLHINDASALICAAAESSSTFDIINGGSGHRVTVREILEVIRDEFGRDWSGKFSGEGRAGDPMHYQAEISRAASLGWKPCVSWRRGVRDYVSWFMSVHRSECV